MSDLDDEFEAFLAGYLSAEEWVDRLLAGAVAECPQCQQEMREQEAEREEARWVDPGRWPTPSVPLEVGSPTVVGAVAGGPQSREPGDGVRRSVERTMRTLRALPADQRVGRIERSWGVIDRPELVELLLAAARDLLGDAPKDARVWIDCAAVVARTVADEAAKARLRVRIQVARATVELVLGKLRVAAALWPEIHADLADHPLEGPAHEAEIWSLEGSFRIATREFDLAERVLDRAERLYRMAGDRAGEAKNLFQRGSLAEYAGDSAAAVGWYRKAASCIEADAEPRLYWDVHSHLAASLASLGQARAAAEVLAAARPVFSRVSDGALRMRLNWVEATIAVAAGRYDEAEQKLSTAAQDCLHLSLAYDFALLQLDLAALYHACRQPQAVKALAAALGPVLAAQDVHEEVKNALLLFQQAARAGKADVALVGALRRYLPLAQLDPEYAFRRAEGPPA